MMKIVSVELDERVVVTRRRLPLRALGPGRHLLWGFGLDDTLRVQVFSVLDAMTELSKELANVIPKDQYADVVVREHERGLLHVQGRCLRVLAPGHRIRDRGLGRRHRHRGERP